MLGDNDARYTEIYNFNFILIIDKNVIKLQVSVANVIMVTVIDCLHNSFHYVANFMLSKRFTFTLLLFGSC
jgi:hypothetical protein